MMNSLGGRSVKTEEGAEAMIANDGRWIYEAP
jgi:hypothetical protein